MAASTVRRCQRTWTSFNRYFGGNGLLNTSKLLNLTENIQCRVFLQRIIIPSQGSASQSAMVRRLYSSSEWDDDFFGLNTGKGDSEKEKIEVVGDNLIRRKNRRKKTVSYAPLVDQKSDQKIVIARQEKKPKAIRSKPNTRGDKRPMALNIEPMEGDIIVEDIKPGITERAKQEIAAKDPKAPPTASVIASRIRQKLKEKRQEEEEKEWLSEGVAKAGHDSFGYRVFHHQVRNVSYLPDYALAKLLSNRIIYNGEEAVAIDKPYGLASHGGPGVGNSLREALPLLAERVKTERLYVVHRLDRETTGCMLLAKGYDAARRLHEMFRKRQVIKRYWALTTKVPDPLEGTIDIPISEGRIGQRFRMKLRPKYDVAYGGMIPKTKRSSSHLAVTHYKVLDSLASCALVELQPVTGIKHQIRVHLGYGLGCPVLGDHKYSHLSQFVPQRLPDDMLERLHVRAQKVRTIPLHLHAKELIVPNFHGGRTLFLSANLPKHFTRNMKTLKIRKPSKREIRQLKDWEV